MQFTTLSISAALQYKNGYLNNSPPEFQLLKNLITQLYYSVYFLLFGMLLRQL